MASGNPGETLAEGFLVNERTGLVEGLFSRPIFDELDAHKAAFSAHITDNFMLLLHPFHALEGDLAEMGGMLEQFFLFDDFGRDERRGASHGVAAVAA